MKIITKAEAMMHVAKNDVDNIYVADMNRPIGDKNFIAMYPIKGVSVSDILDADDKQLEFFLKEEDNLQADLLEDLLI